eukprot:TRINITY_DN40876_c0_g1_i1.p1 TRINITY_DN40876_c0_g1~~TRINITY_DN40876_c0_g1_i1.p1  ORF type:complete len:545 (+),score=107.20 TRINITY_DN40876_c0_g1_i1:109-1743(+)
MVVWGCCEPCWNKSGKVQIINSPTPTGLDSPSRSDRGSHRRGSRSLGPNIGLGLGSPRDDPPVPVAAALSAAHAKANEGGAARIAEKTTPGGWDDEKEGEFEEFWALPFRRARRRRGEKRNGSKGWAMLREKRSELVVMHKFLSGSLSEQFAAVQVKSASPDARTKPRQVERESPCGGSKAVNDGCLSAKNAVGSQNIPLQQDIALRRANSQDDFAQVSETIIIFDWDDTLFPTTYVRDDLDLSCRKPVERQSLSKDQKKIVSMNLEKVEIQADKILRLANTLGRVVLVTLAKYPWVTECCKQFFSKIGKTVDELQVRMVYAQEGEQIDYDKQKMMSDDDIETFYIGLKGRAIAREVASFYSRYEGQTWKNIISIGDSDFERLGTFQATEQYVRERGLVKIGRMGNVHEGLDEHGRSFRVRTKSFRIIDQPTPEEMHLELQMILDWLPRLVFLDDACDFTLDEMDCQDQILNIESTLRGITVGTRNSPPAALTGQVPSMTSLPSIEELTRPSRSRNPSKDSQTPMRTSVNTSSVLDRASSPRKK